MQRQRRGNGLITVNRRRADDGRMWQRRAGLLPGSSLLLPLVHAEVRRLDRELGL